MKNWFIEKLNNWTIRQLLLLPIAQIFESNQKGLINFINSLRKHVLFKVIKVILRPPQDNCRTLTGKKSVFLSFSMEENWKSKNRWVVDCLESPKSVLVYRSKYDGCQDKRFRMKKDEIILLFLSKMSKKRCTLEK